jgi:type VI secretion system Hcp family effector
MRKLFFLLLLTSCFIATKAQKVYMKVEGSKSGIIKDQNMPPKWADRIELNGYSFESNSPTAASSGIAVGRRSRSPFIVTKNNGQSSILLFSAHLNNELLKTVTIEVVKVNNVGMETVEQTITLTNVVITYFKQSFDGNPAPGADKGPTDEIRFSYQKINIKYNNSGVEAEDSWNNNQ